MSYREKLKERLIWEEGLRYSPYKDTAGVLTIGVGHNMDANPLPRYMMDYLTEHGRLELTHVMELLEKDIDYAEKGARALFEGFNDFSENRKIAIVDLVFNLGLAGLRKFVTFGAAVRNGQWDAAAGALKNSKWYRQVGRRADGIIALIKEGGDNVGVA